VVTPGKMQSVGGVAFRNYGSHTEVPYPSTYMTAAAALGTTRADVDELVIRLDRCFTEFRKKCATAAAAAGGTPRTDAAAATAAQEGAAAGAPAAESASTGMERVAMPE
jgi:O-phospho-L-seryl-tRNASec:L-selenocysteinyl-tRNA synthase